MLTYPIDQRGSLSLYEFLYRCIKTDIERGVLPADTKLPSKRTFAQHLGVSLITVQNAYAQLLTEGYLYTRPRRGYYVMPLPHRPESEQEAFPPGGTPFEPLPVTAWAPASNLPYDFSQPSQVDGLSVQRLWAQALRSTLADEPPAQYLQEFPAAGSPRLRNALAQHLRSLRGMNVDPACIVVGSGAQTLYNLLIQLLGHNRCYAIEDPGYPKLGAIYRTTGCSVAYVPLDSYGMRVDALRKSGASVAHIMPSHQFPTGIVTTAARRYELLAWATEQEERYLIEDDYDCEFRLAGRPIPALQSIDRMNKVIYTNTFSKSLGPEMRVAYMILPKPLIHRFNKTLGFYSNTVNAIVQNALARLIESGAFERHINRVRTDHRMKRDDLLQALHGSRYHDKLIPAQVDAGLHFILNVTLPIAEEELIAAAREHGVGLTPLSRYRYDKRRAFSSESAERRVVRASASSTAVSFANDQGTQRREIETLASVNNADQQEPCFVMHYGRLDTASMDKAVSAMDSAIDECLAHSNACEKPAPH